MGQELVFVGAVILVAIASKGALTRVGVPPLVGYLAVGFVARLFFDQTPVVGPGAVEALEALGLVGVTVLLFRVGLKSNVGALLAQLRRATPIWLANIVVSAFLGYAAAAWILGWDTVTSIVVAIALTATSVGVATAVWTRAGRLETPEGELFIDVAELDDITGVVAVAALLSVLVDLPEGEQWPLDVVASSIGAVMLVLAGFVAAMYAFAHWAEGPTTRLFERVGEPRHPMLLVAATGLVFAGAAEMLGLSVAVGAFFAGLAYSRDPVAVQHERDFEVLYDLFVPFFFIQVGLQVTPGAFADAIVPGLVLLAAAIVGKVAGTFVPGLFVTSGATAGLLAVSMIPRAEIALLVSQQTEAMGYIPNQTLSAVTFVSAVTCLGAPWLLNRLLRRREA
ncbi:MAG TPA: cation:proton antiporter [Jiangellaceae bacterium]